jgi:Ni,Fe-hydrogenase I cytochrome b subunit
MKAQDSSNELETRVTTTVWDLPVRIFHWVLVLLVVSQVVTATIGGNAMEYHALGGFTILTLVLFRILWDLPGRMHVSTTSCAAGAWLRAHADQGHGREPSRPQSAWRLECRADAGVAAAAGRDRTVRQ